MTDLIIHSAGSSRFIHTGSTSAESPLTSSNTNRTYAASIHLSDRKSTENLPTTDVCETNNSQCVYDYDVSVPIQCEFNDHVRKTILIEHDQGTLNSQVSNNQVMESNVQLRRIFNVKLPNRSLNNELADENRLQSNKNATSELKHDEKQSTDNSMYNHSRNIHKEMTRCVSYSTPKQDEHLNRRYSSAEQHYDYPADVIQRLRQQQNDRIESNSLRAISHLSDSTATTRLMPSIVPFNVLKRMDHLNTIFIKPTRIERPLPKLVFQDNDIDECSTIGEEKTESKALETSVFDESDFPQQESTSSSLLFYEKVGLSEVDDDQSKNGRRVRFSTAPIKVYPTYSPSEYDRRNQDIDPFSASAEYELEKRIEKMDVFRVDIYKGSEGLGMSVLGMGVGADSGIEKLGIFVKSLTPQGVIAKDGRIQVGDQIIEVNENNMVGVTHMFATNVLKTTSGSITFLIGREKEPETSEVLRLIQRSLQMDQDRLNDSTQSSSTAQRSNDIDRDSTKSIISHEYEMEILKECFESLEKTLENVEKEKDYYEQLYRTTTKDLQEIQEKYIKAAELINELTDRAAQNNQEQIERQTKIQELIKKIEKLEHVIATASQSFSNNPSDLNSNNDDTVSSSRLSVPFSTIDVEPSVLSSNGTRSRTTERNETIDHMRSISVNSKLNSSDESKSDRISTFTRIDWHEIPLKLSPISVNLEDKSDEYSVRSLCTVLKTPLSDSPKTSNVNDSIIENEYFEVKDWSSDRCVKWLTDENFESLIPLFLDRNINGEKLLSLDSTKMKAMGIKSSKDRDRLKQKLKQLKHADLIQIRERFLSKPATTFERVITQGRRFRSSSLTKLKDRHFFTASTSNWTQK